MCHSSDRHRDPARSYSSTEGVKRAKRARDLLPSGIAVGGSAAERAGQRPVDESADVNSREGCGSVQPAELGLSRRPTGWYSCSENGPPQERGKTSRNDPPGTQNTPLRRPVIVLPSDRCSRRPVRRRGFRYPVRGDQPADGDEGTLPGRRRLRPARNVHGRRRYRRSWRRRDPDLREFAGWAVLFGAAEAAAAVMPAAWAYDVLLLVIGAAIQLFAVSATVYVQQDAPAAQRGHALSSYNPGSWASFPRVRSSSQDWPHSPEPAGHWPCPAW